MDNNIVDLAANTDNTIVGLTAIALGLVLLMLVFFILKRSSLRHKVMRLLSELLKNIDRFDERLKLIDSHTVSRVGVLSKGAVEALYQTRRTIDLLRIFAEQLHLLANSRDIVALEHARLALERSDASFIAVDDRIRGIPLSEFRIVFNWQEQIEEYLQRLGHEIAVASENSKRSGLPNKRKRSYTQEDLMRAGVLPNYPRD